MLTKLVCTLKPWNKQLLFLLCPQLINKRFHFCKNSSIFKQISTIQIKHASTKCTYHSYLHIPDPWLYIAQSLNTLQLSHSFSLLFLYQLIVRIYKFRWWSDFKIILCGKENVTHFLSTNTKKIYIIESCLH